MAEQRETEEGIEMVEKKKKPDPPNSSPRQSGSEESSDKFATLISRLYGPDYVAARKLLNRRLKNKGMGAKPALSLYDRIMLYRKMKEKEDAEKAIKEEPPRKIDRTKSNNSLDSVDISQYTNNNNEPRTPTPKPTITTNQRRTGSAHDVIRRKREQVQTRKRSLSAREDSLRDPSVTCQCAVTSLKPGYVTVPKIISTDQNHMKYVYITRSMSVPELFGSGSDVQAHGRDAEVGRNFKRVRKKRRDSNPNEFTLAEKVFLQRKVIAAFGSFDTEQDTLRLEQDEVKATPRDVFVDIKETNEVIEERTTPLLQNEKVREKVTVKEEKTVFPPVRSSTPQRPHSASSVKSSEEKTTLPPITKEEKVVHKEVVHHTDAVRVRDAAVVGAAVTSTRSERERRDTTENKRVEKTSEVSKENVRKEETNIVKEEIKKNEVRKEDIKKEEIKKEEVKQEEKVSRREENKTEKDVHKEESRKTENSVNKMEERKDDSSASIDEDDVRAVITSPRTPREATPAAEEKASEAAKPPPTPPAAAPEPPAADDDDIAALDKLADYNLKSLMGEEVGEAPKVNSELMDKVFSPEFQNNLDNFLAAR